MTQAGHAGGKRADAGHDHAVRLKRLPVVGGQCRIKAEIGERTHHGTHVAESIVEYHHRCHVVSFSLKILGCTGTGGVRRPPDYSMRDEPRPNFVCSAMTAMA